MQYTHEIADFAERTLFNPEHIERIAVTEKGREGAPTAYPVTQLMGSLLGLIVFPKERYNKHIPDVLLSTLRDQAGWPELEITYPVETCPKADGRSFHKKCESLAELVRVLRNGVSHFNVDTGADQHGSNIRTLQLSNHCPKCRKATTSVTLSIEALRDFAILFAEIIVDKAVEHDGYVRRRPAVNLVQPGAVLTRE